MTSNAERETTVVKGKTESVVRIWTKYPVRREKARQRHTGDVRKTQFRRRGGIL